MQTSEMFQIFIRADASSLIGSGHVIRCISLAEGFRSRGYSVIFICADLEGNLNEFIRSIGFECRSIPGVEELRADAAVRVLSSYRARKILIIDHYGLDSKFETGIRSSVEKIVVLDDLANRAHECDLLVDQNFYIDANIRYKGLVDSSCQTLLGPDYSLLRRAFPELRRRKGIVERKRLNRLLVFFGGVDSTGETQKVLRAIESRKVHSANGFAVDVVIGVQNRNRNEVEDLVSRNKNTRLFVQTNEIEKLMFDSDCSLGAGGTATWERFCAGIPSYVITVAENQVQSVTDLDRARFQISLGSYENVTEIQISALLDSLESDFREASAMGLRGATLVDGLGVDRVLDSIISMQS